ncbi:MAG: DUF488 domain-containing protein [Chloroflexi bacterium]|nr:DUF488 domain-containing protein [Chloroflexota bacterium]
MPVPSLRLPEKSKDEQRQSKVTWNLEHCKTDQPDFYTIGYAGRSMGGFLNVLTEAGVATLVDIRFAPVSRFKPEFSKNNLMRALREVGITYIHRPDWGVPRDIRAFSIGKNSRDDIWAWYDANVLPSVVNRNLDLFFNTMEHPVAYMCVEYDPTECHRHRVSLGLERQGLVGCDL